MISISYANLVPFCHLIANIHSVHCTRHDCTFRRVYSHCVFISNKPPLIQISTNAFFSHPYIYIYIYKVYHYLNAINNNLLRSFIMAFFVKTTLATFVRRAPPTVQYFSSSTLCKISISTSSGTLTCYSVKP